MSTAEELKAGARALRSQLLPMVGGNKILAAWAMMGAPSSVGGQHPKDCAAWLQRRSLKLGAVPADGRCQYIAFSRAAFNDDQFADELRRLAVLYLRLHKSTFYESMQADLQDRHHALRKLVVEKKISSDDYDGFMEALEKGLEYGNDHTLRAMTILMRLEARVIKNLNCPASAMEPRLHGVSKDPRDKVGSIKGVIYLFLDREHYSTIEDDPQPLVTGRSSSLSSDVGSVYSERPGSIHTDKENDVTYDYEKPILVNGEEYTAGELLFPGVSLGDGTRLVMEPSDSGKEWVVSLMYVQGGPRALSELRRLPRILAQGPPKKVRKTAPLAEESPHELDADPAPEDMQKFAGALGEHGLGATAMLAQSLYELMTYYVSMLNLHRNESDESPLGMLGNEILEILDELKMIKRRLAFTVTPESQPIQQAMVVGVPGAGKSTLVNELMRHCLRMEDSQPSEPEEVEITDDVFSEGGSAKPGTVRQQLLATQRDEEAVLEQTKQDKNVKYRFNISGDDILPTGSGAGAMTALVTHIFLDPTASCLELRLKYREKAEVDKVLSYAHMIREHGRAVKSGESLPELPDIKDSSGRDVDVTTQAYFACALLGLENKPGGDKDGDGSDDGSDDGSADGSGNGSGDDDDAPDAGVEQLQRHEGAFKLPARFDPLYGCERRLTLQGRSKPELLAQIQELLLVHTIGHWSHWAVLEKVELVVPSNLTAPLRVCDVPGFGDDTLDPFRQQLVNEALKLQCSTLCLVLKHGRLKDDAQEAAKRLGKLGIYEDLFGLNKQRRVGKLTTVVALDWAVKEYTDAPHNKSKRREAIQEYIKDTHDHHKRDSQSFLKAKLKKGVQSRLQGTDAAVVKERVDSVMKTKTQAFVVAVREAVVEPYMDEDPEIPWRMGDLVANLLSNNADNLSRQQEDCLEKLVGLCLLPLYSRLDQLGRLRSLKPDQRVKKLKQKSLLEGVRSTFENEFGGSVNKRRADQLKASVLDPKMSACTAEAVSKRYSSDKDFEHYRKKSSRKLGNDMRSHNPETTLLPELTMRPMATEVVLPLQDKLHDMEKELIDKPADEVEHLVRQIISRSMEGNMEQAPEQAVELSSAMATLDHGFVENVRHVKEYFHQKFRTKINQLPTIHTELLHDTLVEEKLPAVAKKYKTNIKKRDELGKRAEGGTGMAQQLSKRLQSFLRKEVLDDFKDDFQGRFEKAVTYLTGMIIKAQSGDIADLEQLSAFHYSKNCALRVAGMIHAVHASKLTESTFARMPMPDLDAILRFAEQPRLALNVGEASGIAVLSGAVSRGPSAEAVESSDYDHGSSDLALHVLDADGSEATGEQWHCPSCGVSGAQTDMSQKRFYGLTKPCLFKSEPDCWCEAVEDQEVCRLCVRMFHDKHKRRGRRAEQSRKSAKRRASFSAPDNPKRARNDGAASQSSSSALVQVLQRDERSCDGSVVSI